MIELGLGPELTYIVDPAAIGPRLNVDLVITIVGVQPALSDRVRERLKEFGSRTVDYTVIMETGVFHTFKDGDNLDPFSVSVVAGSVDPLVEPIHEVSEVSNRSVGADPVVDRGLSESDNNRLLQCQGD